MPLASDQLLEDPRPIGAAFLAAVSVISSAAAVAEASSPDGNPFGACLFRLVAQASRDLRRTCLPTDTDLLATATLVLTDLSRAVADASLARRVAARGRLGRPGGSTE